MEFYRKIITENYQQRKRINPAYSLRAFSKFLEIPAATVSEVIRGNRRLPTRHAQKVAKKLELAPSESSYFIQSVYNSKASLKGLSQIQDQSPSFKVLDEGRCFHILSEWEYFALLNLIETDGFRPCINWISNRLGISLQRSEEVLTKLEEAKLISKVQSHCSNFNFTYQRTNFSLSSTQDIESKALKQSHQETLKIAAEKIEKVPVEERFYSSSTLAIDPEKLPEAKELIREFRNKLCTLLEQGSKKEVYHMNFQLLPISNKENKHENP